MMNRCLPVKDRKGVVQNNEDDSHEQTNQYVDYGGDRPRSYTHKKLKHVLYIEFILLVLLPKA